MPGPTDNRPVSRRMNASTHVHARTKAATLRGMSDEIPETEGWDARGLFAVLDPLLKASPFEYHSQLAIAAGMDASTISRWRRGKSRPTTVKLSAIARTLGVPGLELWEAAGLVQPGTMHATGVPSSSAVGTPTVSQTPIPEEMLALLKAYARLDGTGQETIRTQLRMVTAWAEGELSRSSAAAEENTPSS